MKFIHRLGFYLGGLALGLIILAFFFQNKKTSCAYGPNARTLKNINQKELVISPEVFQTLKIHELDSTNVIHVLRFGDVDFGKSLTDKDSCKIYFIEKEYKAAIHQLKIENCSETATVLEFQKIKT